MFGPSILPPARTPAWYEMIALHAGRGLIPRGTGFYYPDPSGTEIQVARPQSVAGLRRRQFSVQSEVRMAIRVKSRSGETVEQMMRRFKKLCEKEGLIKDIRRKEFYEKPSERRRRAARKSLNRRLATTGEFFTRKEEK